MDIISIIKSLLTETKKVEILKLPSQGLFYKEDFSLMIKKADTIDILEYENNFDKENLISAINCIKKVVSKNVVLSKKYTYEDIKSVDIIFIFLEIVKFTKNKDIKISYIDSLGDEKFINFNIKNFNYYDFDKYMKFYDKETREFIIDGYRFSLPSIGVETALTHYLSIKTKKEDVDFLNGASYDFMFFLSDKATLTHPEIDNLIQIFNYDLDSIELDKVKSIVNQFKGIVGYSLVTEGSTIEIKTKINLTDIWKI
jgi:hypothetical protein